MHDYRRISTWPFKSFIYHTTSEEKDYSITVKDDVWIGYDALIMAGVTIGQGAVIGARSIVTKDIPPYSVYVGNKVIKKRFSDDIIEKLMRVDYSKINHSSDDRYKEYVTTRVTECNVDKIIDSFID